MLTSIERLYSGSHLIHLNTLASRFKEYPGECHHSCLHGKYDIKRVPLYMNLLMMLTETIKMHIIFRKQTGYLLECGFIRAHDSDVICDVV